MATPTSQAPLHKFPSTWTAPKSCFASTNYYRVFYGDGFVSNLYGTPTPVFDGNVPSGPCIPPSFTINQVYTTDGGCPVGFTTACVTGVPDNADRLSALLVTCCPSVASDAFSFMCRDHQYGCHATATDGATWTGTITKIGLSTPTQELVTRIPNSAEGLEAWGIKLLVVPSTGTVKSATPSTSSGNHKPTQTHDSDASTLSAGAIAGIAVGSIAGVLWLALAGFLLYRKQRHAKLAPNLVSGQVHAPGIAEQRPAGYNYTYHNPERGPYQLDAPQHPNQLSEM